MKKICVYSGSNLGNHPSYHALATELGTILAQKKIELVYGGSNVGLMGAIADRVLQCGGKVTGVMPKNLFPNEIIHPALTKLIEVNDMHERKKNMFELSDGFIALPGGIGTYEEVFEILSWAQIGIHHKPVGFLNAEDFFSPLFRLLQHTVHAGFMNPKNLSLFRYSSDPLTLVEELELYEPPVLATKWLELNQK
ncbi:TIGR00730 family Rossman fold protein [Anaerocolumna sp. AGMB13020]|uniref:LOG family protein n=1 Tax=Anaerocolumna sp. AGMB13020 TaxID=3081750 RepID=UPI0029546E34|nr:TIGR00730 family Rossman fold protein [Anaerocolumna sp. AGMB13020]WOO35862.1 TIGR00730 family Rossman fold protein [Anaerocolumna sp. AGMB13020]